MYRFLVVLISVVLAGSDAAYAYVGPGLGAGLIATIFGILGAIFLALMSIVWYPVKRLLRSFARRNGD